MKTLSITFTPGQRIPFEGVGNYFQLLETSAGVDIEFMRDSAVTAYALNMEFGYYIKPDKGFTGFAITSATAQTIKVVVGNGDGGYNRSSGFVQIIGQQGAFSETQSSVTNADNTIKAANAARKYLLVQNNSAAGVLRLTVDGAAATATRGIRIQPGGYYEPVGFVPSGAIRAFMETADATANNVEVIEA